MPLTIRRLHEADWQSWQETRLEALQLHPEAFGSSFEEEQGAEEAAIKARLRKNMIFAAFNGQNILGIAGIYGESCNKKKHRGNVFSVYVKPTARGQAVAETLLRELLSASRPYFEQIHLSVVTSNTHALSLYQKLGFVLYGTDPKVIKIGTAYHDEYLMVYHHAPA